MPTDLEIAHSGTPRPIVDVAADLGLMPEELELYGRDKAKISLPALERLLAPPAPNSGGAGRGKLIVVTAITPTPAGEGKTTVTIGLVQGLRRVELLIEPVHIADL